MMTDRFVLIFVVLILIGVVAIVIYYSLNPDDDVAYIPEVVRPPGVNDRRRLLRSLVG